jgi:hypothetical protein
MKKWATTIGLLLLLSGAVTAAVMFMSKNSKKAAGPMLGDDAYVENSLEDGATTDLDAWLEKSSRRMVMGMSNKQALALGEKWRALGAKRVVAFGASMTVALAVELPAGAKQRAEFFDWENQHHYDFRKPPAKDVGQRWLLMPLKP